MRDQETEVTANAEMSCPSLDELMAHANEASERVSDHLSECARCRGRLRLLQEARPADESVGEIDTSDLPAVGPPREKAARVNDETLLSLGAVCSVASDNWPGERLMVVVLSDSEAGGSARRAVTVAPISIETEFAADWDLVVPANENPLHYPLIVETWNIGRAGIAQLDQKFGFLQAAGVAHLRALWQASLNRERAPENLPTGAPIIGYDDPRIDFQRDEADRVRGFYDPFVEHVEELAGGFVVDIRDRLRSRSLDVETITRKTGVSVDVVSCIFASGFTHRPSPEDLGRISRLAGLALVKDSADHASLYEEASAWFENESGERPLTLQAARRAEGWFGTRIVKKFAQSRQRDPVAEYTEQVRAAAERFSEQDG
jgi:hypothetical protein